MLHRVCQRRSVKIDAGCFPHDVWGRLRWAEPDPTWVDYRDARAEGACVGRSSSAHPACPRRPLAARGPGRRCRSVPTRSRQGADRSRRLERRRLRIGSGGGDDGRCGPQGDGEPESSDLQVPSFIFCSGPERVKSARGEVALSQAPHCIAFAIAFHLVDSGIASSPVSPRAARSGWPPGCLAVTSP